MRQLVLALVLAAALPAARAVEYNQVLPERSTIGFGYQQMGVKMDGRFRKFAAQFAFDPAKPAAARASFDVDLASIDVGDAEANQEVAGKPWFDTRSFPSARFVSTGVKPLGGDRYEIAGQLTIKGRTQNVVVPASFAAQGNAGAFDGALSIRRGDFAVGEGAWAKFDIVANDVQIKFHIAVTGK